MKSVYVVQGYSGEYSDFREWSVRAFGSIDDAISFTEKCNQHLRESDMYIEEMDGPNFVYEDRETVESSHPCDPQCQIDYTGSGYRVITVPYGPTKTKKQCQIPEPNRVK